MSNDNAKEFDLSVLDVSLDDIDDLPSFDCPPNGTYQLLVNATTKVFEGKEGKPDSQCVVFDYEIVDVIELADKTGPTAKAGDKFGELFGLGSEDGIKYLKKAVLPYAAHFSTNNLRELISDKIQQVIVTATVKGRKDKNDPDKKYAGVSNVIVS